MGFQLLNSDSFLSSYGIPSEGLMGHTFIGKIRLNDNSEVRAYLKLYPEELQVGIHNRSLENESIGYVLADCCGLKVPLNAGYIQLKYDQIPNPPRWLPNQDTIAWFSQDEGSESLGVFTGLKNGVDSKRFDHLVTLLIDQEVNTAAVIAFDATINNTDRNPGNALVGSPWTLIDHGKIIGGESWSPSKLDAIKHLENKHNRFDLYIKTVSNNFKFKNSRFQSAKDQETKFQTGKNQFDHLLDIILYPNEQVTADAIKDFVDVRITTMNSAAAIGLVV